MNSEILMKNLLFKWQKSHNHIPCTLFYAHKYRPTLSISVIKSFNICFEPIFHSYHKYRSKGCKIITTKTKNCINSEFSSTIKIHSFSNICWYINLKCFRIILIATYQKCCLKFDVSSKWCVYVCGFLCSDLHEVPSI